MSPNNPSVASEETKKPRSRPSSQSSYYRIHEATSSRHPSSSPSSSKRSSAHLHPATTPSPLKMVTTPATSHQGDATTYYYYNPEMATRDTQAQGYGWMVPTVIEDDDLMFGGKSLSAWYEEERKRLSYPAEEERRGRQRVRQHHSHSHHHSTKSKDSTSSTEQKH